MSKSYLVDGLELTLESFNDFDKPVVNSPNFFHSNRKTTVTNYPWIKGLTQQKFRDLSIGFQINCWNFLNPDISRLKSTIDYALCRSTHLSWLYTANEFNFLIKPSEATTQFPSVPPEVTKAVFEAKNNHPTKQLLYDGRFITPDSLKPSPQRIANTIDLIRDLPFDGLQLWAKELNEDYALGSSYRLFTSYQLNLSYLQKQLSVLENLNFGRVKNNYLGCYPSNLAGVPNLGLDHIDWYDDWSNVLYNNACWATVTKESGLVGLWLDNESYGPYASYANAKYKDKYSLEQYQDQAFLRGKQSGRVLLSVYPEIKIIVSTSLFWTIPGSGGYDNQELLGPWIAGIFDEVVQ